MVYVAGAAAPSMVQVATSGLHSHCGHVAPGQLYCSTV